MATIDYTAMRMLCFRRALFDFFRRWSLYLLIAAVVFGAGSNAPLAVVAGAASLLLWPLHVAAERGWPIIPMTIAYALVGTLPVVLTRPLWWPRHWASAERALPIAPGTIHRSDRLFCALVMAPWQALLAAGAIGIASHGDARRLMIGWAAATIGSVLLSLRWMRAVRADAGTPKITRAQASRRRAIAASIRPLGSRRALVLLPLLRGRANASAALFVTSMIATTFSASLTAWTPVAAGWSLALLAVTALAATSLLRSRTQHELQPLWQEQRQLPLDAAVCERRRRLLVMAPMSAGLVVGVVVLATSALPLRPQVLVCYALALALGCGVEERNTPVMQPTDHAVRWLLSLFIAIAFGSEVVPS
jgi:hypothetical protein